jgi:hypothetical protein
MLLLVLCFYGVGLLVPALHALPPLSRRRPRLTLVA